MGRHRPRRGSLAFYPKKRAKRIYPSVSVFPVSEETGVLGFACYKAGMTHIVALDNYEKSPSYGQQISIPVTVFECPPLFVFGIRAYEKTHYGLKTFSDIYAEKIEKDLARILILPKKYEKQEKIKKIEENLDKISELRLLLHTQPRKIKLKKTPEVFELTISGKKEEAWKFALEKLGKELNLSEFFKEGDYVDTIAITKGKGTVGPVKRFGIKIQVRKAHGHRRHPGTLAPWTPARVLWTAPMAGQLGFQRRTELNKRILKIGVEGKEVAPKGGFLGYGVVSNYALIQGSVPGPRKRLIFIRKTIRLKKEIPLPIISHISK